MIVTVLVDEPEVDVLLMETVDVLVPEVEVLLIEVVTLTPEVKVVVDVKILVV